jgi:Cu(I)/Ag(I) efflux system protein CusF
MKALAPLLAALALSVPAAATADPGPQAAQAVGVVRAVDARARAVTIDPEAIPSLGWPPMTMRFRVADPALLSGLQPGARIRFRLSGETIVAIEAR